eukprot:GILK01005434.1.p1 GENE.GILK01005434.1~~GILK01005434.1.p1  ORF type:complete len:145 (-),score=11.82 GILK01005434.1:95-499(-)
MATTKTFKLVEKVVEKVVEKGPQTIKDLIKRTNRHDLNLFETLLNEPQHALGGRVAKKNWPQNCFWTLQKVAFKDNSHGHAWGVLTRKGETKPNIKKIENEYKRGVWRVLENPAVPPKSSSPLSSTTAPGTPSS